VVENGRESCEGKKTGSQGDEKRMSGMRREPEGKLEGGTNTREKKIKPKIKHGKLHGMKKPWSMRSH